MQGSHVGATGPLVTEIMRKAKGGVLFIDGEWMYMEWGCDCLNE
jgi:hypothetical protein